ncbi:FAD-binding protein [Paraburkholderia panacisoli]|nr:FAD-binding protein [Paraburkholderia panacisoli]
MASIHADSNAVGAVLDKDDRPIPGLFACGNDMNSPVGGQ